MLKADIQKYSTESKDLARDIQELEGGASTAGADKKAGTKVREIERVEYEKVHKDYTESVDAIGKAVAVLKKQAYDRSQKSASAALLQNVIDLEKVPIANKRVIQAFLAKDSEDLDGLAPEADAYEFQSHGVVDMLEKLKDKFIDERSALEKGELEQRHAYDMLQQDLNDSIKNAEASISTKSQAKSTDQQLVATRQGDLGDSVSTMAGDTKYVNDLSSTCSQKSNDFEARQKLRSEEVVAIEKAIEILSSDDVSGAAGKHLPALLQKKSSVLLQIQKSDSNTNPSAQVRVAAYLNDEGIRIGSRTLSMLALRA